MRWNISAMSFLDMLFLHEKCPTHSVETPVINFSIWMVAWHDASETQIMARQKYKGGNGRR